MADPIADGERLASSSNALAFELYATLRRRPGNLAFSPASISAALAMACGGARGETEAQMKRVLHLDGAREAVMAAWGALARRLQEPDGPMKLRIANRLFGEATCRLEQAYLDATRAAYGAALEPVDFKRGFAAARARINGWVEEQTEQRIKDLLPAGALDGETRLVLVNAIYFLAEWGAVFEKERTRNETFHVSASVAKQTPMMHNTASYRVADDDEDVQVVELPYRGGAAAMLVAVPDRIDGLADLEASLTTSRLASWTGALRSKPLRLTLPRFKVSPTPSIALGKTLVELGMSDAFDRDKADFTGIANPLDPRDRLEIGDVYHQAFVQVDEKGTEAAAATAVVMPRGGGRGPAPPPELRVDRPFLFLIVDRPTGLVLFVGRVCDPATG